MMYKMYKPEDFWMMHQAMHPVKISIMHKKHDRKYSIKIKPAVLMNIGIKSGVRPYAIIKKQ